MLLAEYSARWLSTVRPLIRRGTWSNYERSMRLHVLPRLGATPLLELRRVQVRELGMALVANGLAPGSARVILATLRSCLSSAVDDELLGVNPSSGIGRTLRRQLSMRRTRPMAMTPAQTMRFLAVCQERRPALYPLFLCLARAGLRLGEALGLEWRHVELEARWLYVCQSWAEDGIGPLKNGRPFFADVSRQLLAELYRLHARRRDGVSWVFVSSRMRGTPWDRSFVAERMREILRLADLPPGFTPHSLRHGFASTLLRRHAPLGYITRALNHSDPKITLDYARHFANGDASLVDGLDDDGGNEGEGTV